MLYKYELIRKSIHLSSLIIPISLFYFDKYFILNLLIPLSIAYIAIDYLRINSTKVSSLYNKYLGSITRDFEFNSLTGASYIFASTCLIISLFPNNIAIPSLLIMSISDSMASIIGRKYGKVYFLKKSLEGSIAFFLSSILIIIFLDIKLFPAIASILVCTLVEAYQLFNIDDNFSVPFSFAFTYTLFEKIIANGLI